MINLRHLRYFVAVGNQGKLVDSGTNCKHGQVLAFGDEATKIPGLTKLFRSRRFEGVIIVAWVRWYRRYKLSDRDLVEMIAAWRGGFAHDQGSDCPVATLGLTIFVGVTPRRIHGA